jgi:hypothetical protein
MDFSSDVGPGVIDCGGVCVGQYAKGTRVTLTALPDHGSFFDGWQGACSGKDSTCEVEHDPGPERQGAVQAHAAAFAVCGLHALIGIAGWAESDVSPSRQNA